GILVPAAQVLVFAGNEVGEILRAVQNARRDGKGRIGEQISAFQLFEARLIGGCFACAHGTSPINGVHLELIPRRYYTVSLANRATFSLSHSHRVVTYQGRMARL